MFKNLFLAAILCAMANGLSAQTSIDIFSLLAAQNAAYGKVELVQGQGVADLVKVDVASNARSATIEGFRIQLYSGSGQNSKREAQEVKSAAMSAFPGQKAYLTFTAPFWRVRVGNFRNKSESLPVYYQLKKSFPNCYPVKDNAIRITDLQ
jgi:hypothetical protein